ncbi:Glutathione S-transferase [Hondaea fermentalgiana]|uniref:Glutathione S-transferase n=1 Tax=Hondaea fermentalgiana TaxID=2315210 RepID=A0A2R5G733_9STRA|nr:Glutathione S-transferase [Hondaea fermentalgiana]|eukprot:GBG26129.1 Glutathione S-transferase [Hondaea fermentalgiana]
MLKLYGVLGSQPARAVYWVLKLANADFELIEVMPGSDKEKPLGSRNKEYLAKVPPGIVPALEDTETGLVLWESNAIMTYIADKFKMNDLYPEDLGARAKVQQWMNWHHHNSRVFTFALFAPIFRPDIKFSEKELKGNRKKCEMVANLLDDALSRSPYLVGDKFTLADIAVFEDVGECAQQHLALFDFAKHKNVEAWIKRVEQAPEFKESHAVFPVLKKVIDKVQKNKAKL